MYIEKKRLSLEKIKSTSLISHGILAVLFIVLFFLFWNIQIINNPHFNSLSMKNIYQEVEVKAPRGFILDRNKKILVENKLDFSLFLVKENLKDLNKTINQTSSITGLSKKTIKTRIFQYFNLRNITHILIKKNLPLKEVIYIQSRSDEFPEFEIAIQPRRSYPFEKKASHILGYVSEISSEELTHKKDGFYKLGDEIGKSGIEKQYEDFIKGKKGIRGLLRDSLGRIQKVVSEKSPEIGNSIILTIDIDLQQHIENLLQGFEGTVGVVDLLTGEILALVSMPNFDPEKFSMILEPNEWETLTNDPESPFQNKFTQGLYSPGSVFKVVMASAGLQEQIITPKTKIFCSGSTIIYNRIFHCWKSSGHGTIEVTNGLKNSCNIFFYNLGKNMDIHTIKKYAGFLGIGKPTRIDLPNENTGLFPTPEWKQSKLNQKWYPGETISISIGGGLLHVTPSQILSMISTVALKGKSPLLHLLKKIERKGKTIEEFNPTFTEIPIEKKYFNFVIEGLFKSVNDQGTGRTAAMQGYEICGKTGTQQIISKENPDYKTLTKQKRFKPHSWFASFAPKSNPRYAMVVFLEHGGDAGEMAAPIAAKIYEKLFEK